MEQVFIEAYGKTPVFRSESPGISGMVFQAVGVAIPPTIRNVV